MKLLSYAGLLLTVAPAIAFLAGRISLEHHYLFMLLGMVLWFGTAGFWIKPKRND